MSGNRQLMSICSVTSLAGMTAIGLGLPAEAFMDATKYGYVTRLSTCA